MEHYTITRVKTHEDLQRALNIRDAVFIKEQHVSPDIERDTYDTAAYTRHYLAEVDGKVVATGRLVCHDDAGRIGRMAVLPEYRRQGVGQCLLKAIIGEGYELGLAELTLHAQVHARNFYLLAGFVEEGAPFFEAGIMHIAMRKVLR